MGPGERVRDKNKRSIKKDTRDRWNCSPWVVARFGGLVPYVRIVARYESQEVDGQDKKSNRRTQLVPPQQNVVSNSQKKYPPNFSCLFENGSKNAQTCQFCSLGDTF